MKRTLKSIVAAALLLALVLCGSVGCTAGDDDIFANAEPAPASDFEYEATDDGDGIRLTRYIGGDETVVIPSEIDGKPVTELGRVLDDEGEIQEEGVFTRLPVKAVAIPDSVTKIGPHTFSNCCLLKQVSFPKNLELIEDGAFEDCVSLESLDFTGTKLLQIFEESFRMCENLLEVKFPDTLNVIWSWAFEGCTSLTEVDLPDNVTMVGEDAFSNCTSLKVVKLPPNLDMMDLPLNANRPYLRAFDNVPSLEKIIFKDGWEMINGYYFFVISSDAEIIIPASVEKFGTITFLFKESARIVFEGDCPEFWEFDFHDEAPTIYYDPDTKGWENFDSEKSCTLVPIE